ncbi:MAG: tetratricopeptide repeat protein [Methylophilaceae bacterium]
MANSSQPSQQETQRLIQQLNNGQLAAAEQGAKKLTAKHPDIYILHHVLALALDGQQKFLESVASYQNAIKLQPKNADLHFNLGIALNNTNQFEGAINAYKKAIALKPQFFEAYGNLGTVLQRLGLLDGAIENYQLGLTINPQDALGHFNLGTALRDKGSLDAAISSYKKAIALFPNYTDAYNNLGETLRDHGDMDAAVKNYQEALSRNPDHPNANYNMGEFLYLAKKYSEAVTYFEKSQLDDWQARSMYSLYKAELFDDFKTKLDHVVHNTRHTSPFIATLSTHYAFNFEQEDPYNFCKNGFDFVYQNSIPALAEPNSKLLKQLLNDIENTDIAERVQGMLHYGKQSAGNLFKRPEASFLQLADLVRQEFANYKVRFADADCELINAFPDELEFTSSWFVKMNQGGHLDAHIHEIGWISGAVYLNIPTNHGNEAAFEYGIHGDGYPVHSNKKQSDFPTGLATPKVGDIVLFPSSLFHRTIPFQANEKRICIAFDLKPTFSNISFKD